MSKIFYNGIEFGTSEGGSGNADAVDMTFAEYNALTTEEKNDGTIRFITDVDTLPRAEGVGF